MPQGRLSVTRNLAITLVSAALLGAALPAAAQTVPVFTPMEPPSAPRAFQGEMVTDVSYDGQTITFSGTGLGENGFVFSFDGFEPQTDEIFTIQLDACQGNGEFTNSRGLSGNGEYAVGGCTNTDANPTNQAMISESLTGNASLDAGVWKFGVNAIGGLTPSPPPPMPFPVAEAQAANFDGSVVVGFSQNLANVTEAFFWFGDPATAEGNMQGLGFLGGVDPSSRALDVSGGGAFGDTVIVGSGSNTDGTQAAMWTWDGSTMDGDMNPAVTGPIGLSDLAHRDAQGQRDPANMNPVFSSTAWGVSADGSLIVGEANSEAFLLTVSDDTMVGLGSLATTGDMTSRALAVSFLDGQTVVVGRSASDIDVPVNPAVTEEAFIWTAQYGMINLRAMLIDQGVEGLEDWILVAADGLSVDQGEGLTISGWGVNPVLDGGISTNRAWVVSGLSMITPVPEPGTSLLVGLGLSALAFLRRGRASV